MECSSLYETLEKLKTFSELSEVKAKTKLPEGTFTKSAETIKRTIKEHAKDKNHAVKMINFYINRNPNCSNKTEVLKAKKLIENMYDFSALTRKLKSINDPSTDWDSIYNISTLLYEYDIYLEDNEIVDLVNNYLNSSENSATKYVDNYLNTVETSLDKKDRRMLMLKLSFLLYNLTDENDEVS